MVSAYFIFVPDESLRQITLNSLASVICGIREICGYLSSSVFGFKKAASDPSFPFWRSEWWASHPKAPPRHQGL